MSADRWRCDFRERPQKRPLQVLVDLVVQLNLGIARGEGNCQRHPLGEANVLIRILAKRSFRHHRDTLGEVIIADAVGVVQVAFLERIQ